MTDKNIAIDKTTGEVSDVYTGRDIIVAKPGVVEELYGFKIDDGLSFDQRIMVMKVITEVVTGESNRIDRYLNIPTVMLGCVAHPCTVNKTARDGTTDENGNDILLPRQRVVFIAYGAGGKVFSAPMKIAFVATSIDNFLKNMLVPMVGLGIWPKPIIMTFIKTTAGRGNAYSVSIDGVYNGDW